MTKRVSQYPPGIVSPARQRFASALSGANHRGSDCDTSIILEKWRFYFGLCSRRLHRRKQRKRRSGPVSSLFSPFAPFKIRWGGRAAGRFILKKKKKGK